MASLTAADVPPPFLLPALGGGSRSLRHLVVLRRAQAHLKEITARLDEAKPINQEAAALIRKKAFLVERHIDELERYVARRPRSRVIAGLKSVKEDLAVVVGSFAAFPEEVEVVHRDRE